MDSSHATLRFRRYFIVNIGYPDALGHGVHHCKGDDPQSTYGQDLALACYYSAIRAKAMFAFYILAIMQPF